MTSPGSRPIVAIGNIRPDVRRSSRNARRRKARSEMTNANEFIQVLLDRVATAQMSRRNFLTLAGAAGLTAGLSGATVDQALAAGETQASNQAKLEGAYDYIVVGGGGSGSIIAGELSKTGADVLVVESGGADNGSDHQQSEYLVLQCRRAAGLEAADCAGPSAE
jgi:hypothetical protein